MGGAWPASFRWARPVGEAGGASCTYGRGRGRHLSVRLVMEISDPLVDLGVFPIQDIPRLPKSAHEVLAVTGLILERM
jgi:hypothetical protein